MKIDDERAKGRPERVPLYKQKVLTAENRTGYTRRWVNDTPGRVDSLIRAGWALVADGIENTHDGLAQVESQLGTNVRRVVNKDPNAPCRHAVLMEIPTEWYLEDKTEQQKLIDEKEATFDQHGIHRAAGMYGGIQRRVDNKGGNAN